jgi:hypothetical protein
MIMPAEQMEGNYTEVHVCGHETCIVVDTGGFRVLAAGEPGSGWILNLGSRLVSLASL